MTTIPHSLRAAIDWIAVNDYPMEADHKVMMKSASVGLAAMIYSTTKHEIVRRVMTQRHQNHKHSAKHAFHESDREKSDRLWKIIEESGIL